MALPNKSQISDAVEQYTSTFVDQCLSDYKSESGLLGPDHYSGGFCIVFPINNGKARKALRVWHTEIENIKERYKYLSKDIANAHKSFLSDTNYVENGLKVGNDTIDIVLMDWLSGQPLKEYINTIVESNESNSTKENKLNCLADNLFRLFKEMHNLHFAHGDLQHDNIIVDQNGDIKLIDYDNFYTPSMHSMFYQTTVGYSGYQHPIRTHLSKPTSTEKDDYFAELVIYLSIKAIAIDMSLWNIAKDDDYSLLFTAEDFNDIKHSTTFTKVQKLDGEVKALCIILEEYLKINNLSLLRPFDVLLDQITKMPEIISITADKKNYLIGEDICISWDVDNYTKLILNGKDVTDISEIREKALKTTKYTLDVYNYQKHISKSISVPVLPLPSFEFKSDKNRVRRFKHESNKIWWHVDNASKIDIYCEGKRVLEKCNADGEMQIDVDENSTYEIRVTALDKKTIFKKSITIEVFAPAEVFFKSDKEYAFPSIPITLTWNVKNAKLVTLDGESVDAEGHKEITDGVRKATKFVLEVTDEFETQQHPLEIKMLPIPQIKSLVVPTPKVGATAINVIATIPSPIVNVNFPQPELHSVELLHPEIYDLKVETNAAKLPQVVAPLFSLRSPNLWERAKSQISKIFRNYGK